MTPTATRTHIPYRQVGADSVLPYAVIRILFPMSLVLITFAAACGGGGAAVSVTRTPSSMASTPSPEANACAPSRARPAGDLSQTITSGGTSRTYIIHIPTGYDGSKPTPVVLALHGYALGAKQMLDYTKLGALGDERGFVVVAPDGAGTPPHWNWRKAANEPNDVQFVANLLTTLDTELCIDTDMTFVAGFSDGAAMSRVVACDLPDRIAAIGVVASPNASCTAAVPMIAFHGTADALAPFEGGALPAAVGGGTFPPVRRSVSEWARALGCDGLPTISRPAAAVELSTFLRCRLGDGDTLLYTLLGGGHTWPGSAPLPADQFGATSAAIDATAVMWEFFTTHPLAH
jgi:polyhydroxybutyrate depolymerase